MSNNKKNNDPLHVYRERIANGEIARPERLDPIENAKLNPRSLKLAIRAKCWECSACSVVDVKECSVTSCPLYDHRPWKTKNN